jgi:hypothetical protein
VQSAANRFRKGAEPARCVAPPPPDVPAGSRYCPVCTTVVGPEYTDAFCVCGTELQTVGDVPVAPLLDDLPMAPILDDLPLAPILEDEPAETPSTPVVKPSPGMPCLVLYDSDKQPLQYFALDKDALMIGRLDAVKGVFPDIDLDQWFDRATIRKISRQHALILRTRATGVFALRPLVGNTGTQLETQMLEAMTDHPLRPGHRILLGGVIRLKFEIA